MNIWWSSFTALIISASPIRSEILVELYTSQACYACDDAVEKLKSLETNEDVVTLSFHVDYWDYLGYPDKFADPLFGARHAGYQQKEKKELATPEFFVDGMPVNNISELDDMIASQLEEKADENNPLMAELFENSLELTLKSDGIDEGEYQIVIATLFDQNEIDELTIDKSYPVATQSAVRTIENIGTWDGLEDEELTIELPEEGNVVVFLQKANLGEIISSMFISREDING